MARHLVETAVNLIQAKIKADIAGALSDIRINRGDALVTTEQPQSYFITESAQGFRAPAIFIIPEEMNMSLDRGANHINAAIKINITVVVEDRDTTRLAIKAWRYQAALDQVLQLQSLTSADLAVTIKTKVDTALFGQIYTASQEAGNTQGVFRKEVSLSLTVEHYEGYGG